MRKISLYSHFHKKIEKWGTYIMKKMGDGGSIYIYRTFLSMRMGTYIMKNGKGIVLKKGRRYIKLALETNARKTSGSLPGMTKVKPDDTLAAAFRKMGDGGSIYIYRTFLSMRMGTYIMKNGKGIEKRKAVY